MARYKRYFPVSHEINADPEAWEMTKKYGDRSLRFMLEIFSLIDRFENTLKVTNELMIGLSKKCRQTPATCWAVLGQMLANNWLITKELVSDQQPLTVMARNYAEFHRSRPRKGDNVNNKNANFGGEGKGRYLKSSLSSLNQKEFKKEVSKKNGNMKKRKTVWPSDFVLSESMKDYAKNQNIVNPEEEFEHFRVRSLAKGYIYANWEMAWQCWCRSPYQKAGQEEERYV